MTDTARQDWMRILANAPADALARAFEDWGPEPAFTWLRAPEFGAVMVRGRAGGTGAAFNLGEMSVTRCSLKLACCTIGHAYVAGRDRDKARLAALCDALMQGEEASRMRDTVLDPLSRAIDAGHAQLAAKAAATKVDFFTMVRGEN